MRRGGRGFADDKLYPRILSFSTLSAPGQLEMPNWASHDQAVAEYERDQNSERTKRLLARVKARREKLSNPNFKADNEKRRRQAEQFAERLDPTLRGLPGGGIIPARYSGTAHSLEYRLREAPSGRSPVSPTAVGTAIPESTPTLVHFHAMVFTLFMTMIMARVWGRW